MPKEWINFRELCKQLDFERVLASYEVRLEPKGGNGQFVGTCPLPSHPNAKGKTFSANFEKGVWQCFGCNQSGNTIDFAVLMEGKEKSNGTHVREVAVMLRERFVERKAAPAQKAPPKGAMQGSQVVNQPLDFELKTLNAQHPYFAAHGYSKETAERFGLGFCTRGSLAGRIAVPLVDDGAELVGYAGLLLDMKEAGEGNPRYLFPGPRVHDEVTHVFDRGRFLYNGFRIGKAVKDLIVVRECHTVWRLWQGGFANVVALMGDECTAEQAGMLPLLTVDTARVWLLTDSSEGAAASAQTLLTKVTPSRLCRWLRVSKEEDLAPEHPLLEALPKR